MVDDDGDDDESDDCEFGEWARTFRAEAESDDYAIFRDHLRRLGLPDEPLLLLEGTIQFVLFWNSFFSLGRTESFARMLRMQTYDPAQSTDARYAYTFDLCGKAYARVLVDTDYRNLDLADMNEAPWSEYQVVGFRGFWISHLDWSPLTQEERDQLETEIEDDLYFDYSRQELQVQFVDQGWGDEYFDEICLRVRLQEIPEEDQEVDDSEHSDDCL